MSAPPFDAEMSCGIVDATAEVGDQAHGAGEASVEARPIRANRPDASPATVGIVAGD